MQKEFEGQQAPCPKCGQMSPIEPAPSQDFTDDTGAVVPVDVIITCPQCGKFTVKTRILPDGDTGATVRETGEEYEPSPVVRECRARLAMVAQSKEYKTEEARVLDELDAKALIAAVYDSTGRPAAAERMSAEITDDYRKLAAGHWTPATRDRCLKQAGTTATFKLQRGDIQGALKIYDDISPLATGLNTVAATAFAVSRGFLTSLAGKRDAAVPMLREALARAEELTAAGRPAEDPYLLAVACNSLGLALQDTGDFAGALEQLARAKEERLALLDAEEVTAERLRDYVDCARSVAECQIDLGQEKDAMDTLNQAILTAGKYPDLQEVYAAALMGRAKYIQMGVRQLPGFFRADMNAVIAILDRPRADGSYDPLLPLAYLYRSWTCTEDSASTLNDLGKAYDILYEELATGAKQPDSTFIMVTHNYLSLLNQCDKARAASVKAELRQIGISPKQIADAMKQFMAGAQ